MAIKNELKFTRHSNAVAAGTTAITPSAGIDMAGFDTCLFAVSWGAITAGGVQSIEVHRSSDDGSSDAYTAMAGTKVTVADTDDNKITWVEVYRSGERYLKCVVNRATQNSVVDGIIAIQGKANAHPVTQDSTVSGGELHATPGEGTA